MDIYHITFTSKRKSRLPLFADGRAYRIALRKLGRVFGGSLALFALIAEHVHLVAPVARAVAGRLAQAASSALAPMVSTPLAPAHFEPVETRSHMRWLLKYALKQPIKHKMPGHPALWIGSCLPDLLGARLIPGLSLRIREALPDYQDATALGILGLPGNALPPADRETLRAAGAHRLVRAAAAALGADPTLSGNDPSAKAARRAVVNIARRVGIARAEVIAALGIVPTSVSRLAKHEVALDVMLTVARRIALENLILRSVDDRSRAAG